MKLLNILSTDRNVKKKEEDLIKQAIRDWGLETFTRVELASKLDDTFMRKSKKVIVREVAKQLVEAAARRQEHIEKYLKSNIRARKYMGDDQGSWAVFDRGQPVYTGLTRPEVDYYKLGAAEIGVDRSWIFFNIKNLISARLEKEMKLRLGKEGRPAL